MSKKYLTISIILLAAVIGLAGWSWLHGKNMHMVEATQTVKLSNGQVFELQASQVTTDINGKSQTMLAYNGSVPGPTIEVDQNAVATIKFTNKLRTDTALHFHGVRADNASDGVVGVTQAAIKPGESYSYKLTFPDPGVYWYHPHLREDSSQPLGLYGSIIVKPKAANYWQPVNQATPLMIGDILIDKNKIVPFDKNQANYTLMGRFGNTMLVNGSTSDHIFAKPGEVQRFYITNVASVRPFKLAIPGVKIKLVGGDNGKYERETFVDSITLGPSERAIIDVLFDKAGAYTLQNQTPGKTYKLATITVAGESPKVSYAAQFNTLRTNTDTSADMEAAIKNPNIVTKSLKLSMNMSMGGMDMTSMDMSSGNMSDMSMSGMNMSSDSDPLEWEDTMNTANKSSTVKSVNWQFIDQQTGSKNQAINWQFKRGQVAKLTIYNDPNSMHPMQHPIHIHGQRFLVTSINGKAVTNKVWKDTVLVGKGETVELQVEMSNPGNWVIHCHIPEHMESGMLLKYSVE